MVTLRFNHSNRFFCFFVYPTLTVTFRCCIMYCIYVLRVVFTVISCYMSTVYRLHYTSTILSCSSNSPVFSLALSLLLSPACVFACSLPASLPSVLSPALSLLLSSVWVFACSLPASLSRLCFRLLFPSYPVILHHTEDVLNYLPSITLYLCCLSLYLRLSIHNCPTSMLLTSVYIAKLLISSNSNVVAQDKAISNRNIRVARNKS